jgi:hypothetical protein
LRGAGPSVRSFVLFEDRYYRSVEELSTAEVRRSTARKGPGYALPEHLGIYLPHGRLKPGLGGVLVGNLLDGRYTTS